MTPAITLLSAPSPATLPFEIVERKGIGHPDTICDALAENLSATLSRAYLQRFGRILHHNVDKALLVGGAARPAFGGGEIIEPIEIHLAGRATTSQGGIVVPIEQIAADASRAWLGAHLRGLDPLRHVKVVSHIRATSPDLAALFARGGDGAWLANDTSFGVGFAPFDELERMVLAVERMLNGEATKVACPELGEDVKVMGARHADRIVLTVACAFVDRHVRDLNDYRDKKARLALLVREAAEALTAMPVEIAVNAADGDTADAIYLTVTGLSAESGDDGQVGRGNRVSGLITPYRPMSLEAAAGKNPVTHVGKLYNVVAHRVARAIVDRLPQVTQAQCMLLSQIGAPVNEPRVFDLGLRLAEGASLQETAPHAGEIARCQLASIGSIWQDAVAGGLDVW